MFAVAEIAGVGLVEKHVDQLLAAYFLGKLERRSLVDPHQRRMDREAAIHTEIERKLHRLDRVVAAIRIAGEIGLAHAGHDIFDATPISDGAGERQKYEIAARHKGRWQAGLRNLDRDVTREGRVRDSGKRIEPDEVIFAKASTPWRRYGWQFLTDPRAHGELDSMTLAVVKPDRLDA